ncbi:MAG TPA: hypothetical protein VOB72_08495 [Candidatus Dormibacteraeota bacterium]|nr:hypothetical protein [Candidatus Dormibacteraeota bacterium]
MPIVYHQLAPANNGLPTYAIAQQLARQTIVQFGQVRGIGAGIGHGSCSAAVAIAPAAVAGYPAANQVAGFQPVVIPGPPRPGAPTAVVWGGGGALPYAIAFGNSRMAAGGLVAGPLGGHAERAALTAVPGAALHTVGGVHAALFVELTPCANCQNWLNGAGDGVANPFNGVINGVGGTTLHVWWRWEYPPAGLPAGMGNVVALGGVDAMLDFHRSIGFAVTNQLNHVIANW